MKAWSVFLALILSTGVAAGWMACGGGEEAQTRATETPAATVQAETPTAGAASPTKAGGDGSPVWLDHVQAWSTLAAGVVASCGLFGVIWTLRRGRRQQRIQSGPYIRVDVGPTSDTTSDFQAPEPYFASETDVVDLAPDLDDQQKVGLSAWLANYQPHPLGTAFRVAAFFMIEIQVPGTQQPVYRFFMAGVAYIEREKPIKVELFKISRDWTVTLWLSRLSFSDFYDEYHEHSEDRNENALHGRLSCTYSNGTFSCHPEGRPAAPWWIPRVT